MGQIRVGIGGWVFPPWRGTFYPKGLAQARELSHASRQLTAIEINGTFYGAQKPTSFRRWHADTPDEFVFSVKGPRYATHRKALGEAAPSIERFFNSGVLELREKLGPVLWQFAPFTKFDGGGFEAFLALLPHKLDGRAIRHVVEVRHASFAAPAFMALLRKHRVAAALVDTEGHLPLSDVTADFLYARLRRTQADEPTGYPQTALKEWAARFRTWAAGGVPKDMKPIDAAAKVAKQPRDVFVYFINGAKERAPAAAMALIERLSAD
ncbi:MAG: DUF72 domain-containing protein [Hyphomicrobiales bacterium]|nr:DUF72 domain-containing protein [Hyphomicrobiales bacterium]MBV9429900.1 DUF72 domain-containing protein [Bradyrhizobiaceae bacterium]